MSKKYKLYSSEGCHLCEQAMEICSQFISPDTIEIIDIVDDESLVALYGVKIPVFERLKDNKQLNWPFDENQVETFVS